MAPQSQTHGTPPTSRAPAPAPAGGAVPPQPADPDLGTTPVAPEHAEALLKNGHRLKLKGAPASEWFALQRTPDQKWWKLEPIDEAGIAKLLEGELVLAPSF